MEELVANIVNFKGENYPFLKKMIYFQHTVVGKSSQITFIGWLLYAAESLFHAEGSQIKPYKLCENSGETPG